MKLRHFAVIGAGIMIGSAQAQEIDPGLWEFKPNMNMPGMGDMSAQMAEMQQQLDSLPPQARAMMEQQMASMGLSLGAGGAIRVCISPEDAKGDEIYSGHNDGECTYSDVVRTSSLIKGKIACTDPQASGEFETRLNGKRGFTARMNMVSAEGPISGETEARWLSADCGALKR